jgi:hypothetical protein
MTTDTRGMVFNATFNNISVKNIGTVYLDIHSNCLMFYKSDQQCSVIMYLKLIIKDCRKVINIFGQHSMLRFQSQ